MKKLFVLLLCLLCCGSYAQAQNRAQLNVKEILFSPDGKKMAIGLERTGSGGKQIVRLWEVETGKLLWARDAEAVTGNDIAISPDGTLLAVSGTGKRTGVTTKTYVEFWGIEKGELVLSVELGTGEVVDSLAFSPDGKHLVGAVNPIVGKTRNAEVRLWDVATGKLERTLHSYEGTSDSLAISTDGKRMVVRHRKEALNLSEEVNSAYLTLWDLPEFKLVRTLGIGQYLLRGLLPSPNGESLAFLGAPAQEPSTLIFWKIGAPALTPTALPDPAVERVSFFRFTPDGKEMVVTGESIEKPKQAALWVVDTEKSRITRVLHAASPVSPQNSSQYPLAISPDGKSLAIISGQSSIELRSMQDGAVIRKYE